MTGYELRHHLADQHGLELRGLDCAALLAIHDDEHRIDQEHDHDDPADT